MEQKKLRGFATDPERARKAGRTVKSRQSPQERSERARQAAFAKWEKYKHDGLRYEDSTDKEFKKV